MSDVTNMRKLMERTQPTMMPEQWPTESEGMQPSEAMGVVDELDAEFKRITADYLQADGPLDSPEYADMRKKLTDQMTKILDVLHAEWMDDMMGDGGSGESEGDDDEAPEGGYQYFGGTDDDDESDEDDSEEETDADDEAEDDDDDDEESEESEEDDDSDDEEESTVGDDKDVNPFKESHVAVGMRKLMEAIDPKKE